MTKKFDLKTLNPRERSNLGAWVDIRLGGEPVGLSILVKGRFSDAYIKLTRDAMRKQQAEFRATKEFPLMDPDDQDAQRVALAVACTAGWRGESAPGEFSPEAARELYEAQPWIVEQIDKAIGEDARFLKS